MHLKSVAGHHNTQDILAYIMHISLHRRNHHFASVNFGRGCCFHIWRQHIHRIPHHLGSLDNLRKEHLTLAKQLSHMLHTGHERSFNDLDSLAVNLHSFLQVSLQILASALDNGLVDSLFK